MKRTNLELIFKNIRIQFYVTRVSLVIICFVLVLNTTEILMDVNLAEFLLIR